MIFSGVRFKLTIDRKKNKQQKNKNNKNTHLLPSHHCGKPHNARKVVIHIDLKKQTTITLNRAG